MQEGDWEDQVLVDNLEKGASIFGYHRMLLFAKRGQRHDALYAFNRIINLYNLSGLSPAQFYHNILQQVTNDTGTYEESEYTSYQKLNNIAQGFNENISEMIKEANDIKGIKQLDKLLEKIKQPSDVFSNWRMLIQYKELVSLLERKNILEIIQKCENEKLKNYAGTLLFHPSVTDTNAVKLFLNDPGEFFELSSSFTDDTLHENKKPANYYDIPHLDLTAVELRDALVNGVLDKLQVWEPLEIIYEIPRNEKQWQEYQSYLDKELHLVLKETFKGENKKINNKQKLFGKIKKL